jgi:hypothetical protein
VKKIFGVPKILPPENTFCLYSWLQTNSRDLSKPQTHMPFEMLGTLRTGESVFMCSYDDQGSLEKYSFGPQETKPTTHFNLVRDQESHIVSIDDGQQRVEYGYDGQNISEVREFFDGNLLHIMLIR